MLEQCMTNHPRIGSLTSTGLRSLPSRDVSNRAAALQDDSSARLPIRSKFLIGCLHPVLGFGGWLLAGAGMGVGSRLSQSAEYDVRRMACDNHSSKLLEIRS
jgi:hypothetical protein